MEEEVEELEPVEDESEYIEEPEGAADLGGEAMGDAALPEAGAPEALELEDEDEDIWAAEKPEPKPERESREDAGERGDAGGGEEGPEKRQECGDREESGDLKEPDLAGDLEEPLLGEPTVRLLEYLKGLADQLPPDKKVEFDVLGLKAKIDDLIGKINREAERDQKPPPVLRRERGFGLLSSGEALRGLDPRRSALGRRTVVDRRTDEDRRAERARRKVDERRNSDERRARESRRASERRGPIPEVHFGAHIPKDTAPVTVASDGTPTEIAGMVISSRMAKLIQIMRREKNNGR